MNKALELLQKSLQNLKQQHAEQKANFERLDKESDQVYAQAEATQKGISEIEEAIQNLTEGFPKAKSKKAKKTEA